MATLTVEISDDLNGRLERECATGRFKDKSDLVQMLLEAAMRSQWKDAVENKIDEALNAIERGEVVAHQNGDCSRLAREYQQEKRARQAKP